MPSIFFPDGLFFRAADTHSALHGEMFGYADVMCCMPPGFVVKFWWSAHNCPTDQPTRDSAMEGDEGGSVTVWDVQSVVYSFNSRDTINK